MAKDKEETAAKDTAAKDTAAKDTAAKDTAAKDTAAKDTASETSSDAPATAEGGEQAQQTQTLTVDDSDVMAGYSNFCRVSSTPEELILDLGLNPNPYAQGEVTVKVSQRIIMNHYTAKRLVSALSMALQRHEQAFGVLETDVRRRIVTPTR